jgi:hypothetical protein
MTSVIEKLIEKQKEEIYKFLCLTHLQYPLINQKKLLDLWCKEQKIPTSYFDNYIKLNYISCPLCRKKQLVDNSWNFHCSYCPHYQGPAQCTNYCCLIKN